MKHQTIYNQKTALSISFLFAAIVFGFSYDFGMFWDNVLFASKMGNQIYENGLFNWTMPNEFDPGHPPFLGFLLAIFWTIFGHSLWVSHFLMFPFIVGIIFQLQKLLQVYVKNTKIRYFGLLLILADPTLLASFVLVNPETIIIFFFLLAVNGILYHQKKWKFLGLLFLSIITFRSMMLFAGIFLFQMLQSLIIHRKSFRQTLHLKILSTYLLASLPGVIFVIWRLTTKGWLQTHANSPWSSYWQLPSFTEFLKNIAVLIHRYIDFGRVFLLLFLVISLYYYRKRITHHPQYPQLLLLSFSSVFFVIIAVLFSTNAFSHRYFIVSYISFTLLTFLIIYQFIQYKKTVYTLLFLGLLTGNLWVYPEKIAQGWDATLAHVPYHSLRVDAINFLDQKKISIQEVGTFFPNYNPIDEIELNGDQRSFSAFNKENNVVLYANVYNLDDETYENLHKNYKEIQQFKKWNIYVSIFKKKTPPPRD